MQIGHNAHEPRTRERSKPTAPSLAADGTGEARDETGTGEAAPSASSSSRSIVCMGWLGGETCCADVFGKVRNCVRAVAPSSRIFCCFLRAAFATATRFENCHADARVAA